MYHHLKYQYLCRYLLVLPPVLKLIQLVAWSNAFHYKQRAKQQPWAFFYLNYAKKFNKDGYVIIDLKITKKDLKKITDDILKLAKSDDVKKNPKIYHYNKNPRIVEGFKKFKSKPLKILFFAQ